MTPSSTLVMIPGIQGRWEWMSPAVDALSARHRVLTFSLNDVAGGPERRQGRGWFDAWEAHIDRLLDRAAGVETASVLGVSFGGLVAARYAARRGSRVRALILVSAPAPSWTLDARRLAYLKSPLRSTPAFMLGAVARLLPEILAAQPGFGARVKCLGGYLWRVARYPASPRRMAGWVQAWQEVRSDTCWSEIAAPTLVITGEAGLDRVVPVSTTREYLSLIPGAHHIVLPRTGHIGLVSRPQDFADVVRAFIETSTGIPQGVRHIDLGVSV